MSTTTIRRLTDCDTMLATILTHYSTAIRRLEEALPGYPARTPGSGEPGGGKGFTVGSRTERQAGKPNACPTCNTRCNFARGNRPPNQLFAPDDPDSPL